MIHHKTYKATGFIKTIIALVFIMGHVLPSMAQVDFTQRRSLNAPAPYNNVTNYYLQGDFTMIGNTNLTLVNYGNETGNENDMRYVDVDNITSTLNSSSAQLLIPDADCSEIIYAGLYWTGRAHDASSSPNIFQPVRTVNHGGQTNNIEVSVSREGSNNNSNNNYYPRFTLTYSGQTVQIDFTNNTGANRVQYRNGTSGSFTNIPVNYNSSGNTGVADFTTPLTLTIGGRQIVITGLQRDSRTSRSQNNYRSTSYIVLNTKELNKRKVQLKKDGLLYQEITAATNDIYYPSGAHSDIYAAYADVTNYVRANGAGNYFVADIALNEGNGGGTGYSGGWGMVVIYKNANMKWRDITVFDGYGYMNTAAGSKTLSVSGFKAAQNGAVNITMGMMASEGDRPISGDYFEILRADNSNYQPLSHAGNSTNNFFNSSIQTGGNARNPEYLNNTGLDISKFDLPNSGNNIIPNSATSTTFRFGSNQDTYSIFNIVFAVDAYVPEVVGENLPGNATTVHGSSVSPGADLEFELKMYNKGEEDVNATKVEIQIPHNLHYVSHGIDRPTSGLAIPDDTEVNWVPPMGAPVDADPSDTPGGTLVWNIGTLPHDVSKSVLLGTLKYKFKVTTNCAVLASEGGSCGLAVKINGKITGVGGTSGTAVNSNLVRGYGEEACPGPIFDDFESTIAPGTDFLNNCGLSIDDGKVQFKGFCSLPNNAFPRAEIADLYPPGTKFFSSQPGAYESTQDLIEGDFPVNTDGSRRTFYAVSPGMAAGCFYTFQTLVEVVTTSPTVNNVTLCLGEPFVLNNTLSATGIANGFAMYYYDSESSATPLPAAPAPTAAGTYTYWVAEGKSQGGVLCVGPKVPFTITIHALPTVQQDVQNLSLCENNDVQFTVAATGATGYVWEYTTAAAPTVWLTLDNNTFNGQISLTNNSMNVSHAIRVGTNSIDGIKVRLKASNDNGCVAYSNEIAVEVKDCRAITNPMLPNKAGRN